MQTYCPRPLQIGSMAFFKLGSKAWLYHWYIFQNLLEIFQNLSSSSTACLSKKEGTKDDRGEKQKGSGTPEMLLNHPCNKRAFGDNIFHFA